MERLLDNNIILHGSTTCMNSCPCMRSCMTQLLTIAISLMDDWTHALEDGYLIGVIYSYVPRLSEGH